MYQILLQKFFFQKNQIQNEIVHSKNSRCDWIYP